MSRGYKVMYLDMAYTLEMVREKELDQEFLSRDCGAFFEHVWGVHPIADVPRRTPLEYRGFRPSVTEFSATQTVVEGVSAYYRVLRRIYPLNFLISQFRFAAYLARLVVRERISVVVTTDPYLCGLLGLALKYLTGTPLVVWVVANYADVASSTSKPIMPRLFGSRRVEMMIERLVFKHADLVAGGNTDNVNFALANGARPDRATVFPVGKLIHPSHRTPAGTRTIDPATQRWPMASVFIYVGRLVEAKCPDDVLRAFAVCHAHHAAAALVIAGDGPMKEQLTELAAELGVSNRVLFAGGVSQQRLSAILAGCVAAISPLTGRALLEVALAGLPIVAYERDWQKEFIETSGGGVVVPFRNWEAMGREAVRLLDNPSEARAMGARAREKALELCDLDRLYGHEQEAYRKLIERRA